MPEQELDFVNHKSHRDLLLAVAGLVALLGRTIENPLGQQGSAAANDAKHLVDALFPTKK